MKPQSYGSHSNCTMGPYIKGRDITTQGSNQICMRDLHYRHLEDCASLKSQSHEAPQFCPCQEEKIPETSVLMGTGELDLAICRSAYRIIGWWHLYC